MGNDEIWAAIFGGLIGAALASPKPEDKQALENYKRFQQEINARQRKITTLPDFNKLAQRSWYYNAFIESYRAYSFGLFRSSVVVASALIESMLREKFEGGIFGIIFVEAITKKKEKRKNFYGLIEEAKKQEFLSQSEYYFLHGLRSERNDSVHDVLREISEGDAVIILNIAIKIIDKLN